MAASVCFVYDMGFCMKRCLETYIVHCLVGWLQQYPVAILVFEIKEMSLGMVQLAPCPQH